MSDVTDFMRYPADQRDKMILNHMEEYRPIIRDVFLRNIRLEDPSTGMDMTVEDRRELWTDVYLCLYECCYRALEAQKFRILSNAWPLLISAAFLLSIHSLLGYDVIPSYEPVNVAVRRPNGSMQLKSVDYMTVVLSNAFNGEFMPEDVKPAMYKVFSLTGWKGCERVEGQKLRKPELAALVAEGERYRVEHEANRRAAMGRDAARGEWTALRRIEMDGSGRGRRKKTRRFRGKSLGALGAGRALRSLSPVRVIRAPRRGSTRARKASRR